MILAFSPPPSTRRSTGLAVTLLVHALLIAAWQYSRSLPAPDLGPRQSIQWIDIAPSVPRTVRDAPPPPPPTRVKQALRSAAPRAMTVPATEASAAPLPVPDTSPATAAPAPLSAYEMLQQAKRSVGKIDRDLRKAYPGQPITAPTTNGATRLAKGIEDAADAAPNKWYQAPKVTEIIDPGGYGRRRYRVVGALGTYCITVESNHAPDGIDQMKHGIKQKITTCDDDERAATKQQYP